MKLTKSQLKKLIKEELQNLLQEDDGTITGGPPGAITGSEPQLGGGGLEEPDMTPVNQVPPAKWLACLVKCGIGGLAKPPEVTAQCMQACMSKK